MPTLDVIVQIALLSECEAALGAGERFVFRMYELMSHELGLDAELLAARVARVILLAGVCGHVSEHLLPAAEPLGAVRASVRELVGVQLAVYVERRLGLEGLAARVADVRPLAGMRASMVLPRGLGRERTAAQVAREVLQFRVHVFQVSGQTAGVAKLLAADVTSERPFVLVNSHVPQIRVLEFETFAALCTLFVRFADIAPFTFPLPVLVRRRRFLRFNGQSRGIVTLWQLRRQNSR